MSKYLSLLHLNLRSIANKFDTFKNLLNTLTKAKVWERYGKVWAIYDPYVGMIWDSIDIMWD
jgi:hypothetical protein